MRYAMIMLSASLNIKIRNVRIAQFYSCPHLTFKSPDLRTPVLFHGFE